jgi:hypothetical protein
LLPPPPTRSVRGLDVYVHGPDRGGGARGLDPPIKVSRGYTKGLPEQVGTCEHYAGSQAPACSGIKDQGA